MLDHLAQDWMTPAIALTVSAIGSFLGLSFAARARSAAGPVRWQWLALASLSIGGMAVWSMHFIAMMGFSPPGVSVRYDAVLTVVSGVIAIVVVAVALTMTALRRTAPWLLLGGLVAGVGIVAMHYTGMYSMNVHGEVHHDPLYVALAGAIALVAATFSLWFASRVRGHAATGAAAVAMAVAVTAMHYTGMAGVHITQPQFSRFGAPDGATAAGLLLPLIVGLFVFLLICSLFLLLGVEDERPSYAPRPVHADPSRPGGGSDTPPEGYTPRHSTGPQSVPDGRSVPGGADDVWTRRR
ncbi:histidine kinase [Nocardiopsis sp. TSRI0078]|uniref:MHYT domain-containing protein n=1 Tax=unclassified Nocardiopsis TaxID=2649073 RepID=UPI000939E092|nr:MHYT domain-containing protein [Nocardiopsis sp. TSRI0078]OKI21982.1 histidine kinase [Nocardiopsis sp. TSRI0078]